MNIPKGLDQWPELIPVGSALILHALGSVHRFQSALSALFIPRKQAPAQRFAVGGAMPLSIHYPWDGID